MKEYCVFDKGGEFLYCAMTLDDAVDYVDSHRISHNLIPSLAVDSYLIVEYQDGWPTIEVELTFMGDEDVR